MAIKNGKKPELLAPAGSIEAMHAALKAGADAVYIGGRQFGARAFADNPDDAALLEAIDLVHLMGCRLYLTVNTLFKNNEIEQELTEWLTPFYRQGLDGVIVQDPGAIRTIQYAFPEMELHASTQMAVTGAAGAGLMQQAGICRVVPARELSLEEIRAIHEETGLDIECFIHGAMCYSYSGMCLMSSLIGGRSGNRGRCAGVCRLPFQVSGQRDRAAGQPGNGPEAKNSRPVNAPGQNRIRRKSIQQKNRQELYPLNMKDLCALDVIPDLIEAGCTSFKIEGRMKRPEYTAGVTQIYRKYLDRYLEDPSRYHVEAADRKRLETLFNRDGLSGGYYQMRNGRSMIALHNQKIEEAEAKKRSREAQDVYARIEQFLEHTALNRSCSAEIVLEIGKPVRLGLSADDPVSGRTVRAEVTGDTVQAAERQPVLPGRIEQQMKKTGDSAFRIDKVTVTASDPHVFLPISRINDLRRNGLHALEDAFLEGYRRTYDRSADPAQDEPQRLSPAAGSARMDLSARVQDKPQGLSAAAHYEPQTLWVQIERRGQLDAFLRAVRSSGPEIPKEIAGISLPVHLTDSFLEQDQTENIIAGAITQYGWKLRFHLPYVIRRDQKEHLERQLEQLRSCAVDRVDGILVRSLEGAGIMTSFPELSPVLDAGLFIWNDRAIRFFRSLGFHRDTIPLELNRKELRRRDNTGSEMILYGRAPMMISAQCVRKTMQGCAKQHSIMQLADRKGAAFPVTCECDDCYNVIYNSLPSSLIGQVDDVIRMTGVKTFRIVFTTETEEEMQQVLAAYRGERAGTVHPLPFPVTGGHYKRGVL